ncbi:DUF368 domain-containing protein [Alkalihalobacillus pseudalcaliphilus]|uniref:DUF368 domain-containing protein n=1 Tax=Alkalihalobacillus pseudalcaliphilus TaxID=79884 RepID=UPI00064D92A8|nr:DUF368 domain-containing protein [Alkalihalobacillus pseudalcaliphilus]KMK75833.1 hypothetical protein AB990_11250 [Alkalihalobacillus pseudalcaliphilus]
MNWKNSLRGIAMGIVEAVPGVSSSTIAMLLGIYERVIESLQLLSTKNWRKAIYFLVPIGVGVVIGLVFSLMAISFLLQHYPLEIHYFFIGLIIGMLPFIWRSGLNGDRTYKGMHYFLICVGFIFVAGLNWIPANDEILVQLSLGDYFFLFGAGWIGSVALVLPGISGALILNIVGAYETAVHGAVSLNWPVIFAVGSGVLIGVLMTAKLVYYLINHYYQQTYAVIIGILSGALVVLYPGMPEGLWQLTVVLICLIIGMFGAFRFGQSS